MKVNIEKQKNDEKIIGSLGRFLGRFRVAFGKYRLILGRFLGKLEEFRTIFGNFSTILVLLVNFNIFQMLNLHSFMYAWIYKRVHQRADKEMRNVHAQYILNQEIVCICWWRIYILNTSKFAKSWLKGWSELAVGALLLYTFLSCPDDCWAIDSYWWTRFL